MESVQQREDDVRQRKQQVLTQEVPSVTSSIAKAVVIKDDEIYLLSERDGSIPFEEQHGFGLYFRDCRYLNGYELRLDGEKPTPLVASDALAFKSVVHLTNPEIERGANPLRKETIGLKWERVASGERHTIYERITLENFSLDTVETTLSLHFRAAFEDVFAIRGLLELWPGSVHPPKWMAGGLCFLYDGADGRARGLIIRSHPQPDDQQAETMSFRVALAPRATAEIHLALVASEAASMTEVVEEHSGPIQLEPLEHALGRSHSEWLGAKTEIRSDSRTLNLTIERSLLDLRALRTKLGDEEYFAAGLPWFATLFGRDSVLTAMQVLAFDPGLAADTLRLLAARQGSRVDDWRDEQPGKILHELRQGELARAGEIPHTPYYGTVDATLLFLILFGRHAAWTGTLQLFQELRDHVDLALEWIDAYGDVDQDGYIEYESTRGRGLINQGWKDSGNAIVNADGTLAEPPIAMVEVQAYIYRAKQEVAKLYRRAGDEQRATKLEREAAALQQRFKRDFWWDEEQFLYLGLQAGNRPLAVASSNPGHALWAGIVDDETAAAIARRLMREDLFNGWGIRTLSSRELRYNPMSYHLGSVWPHDNAIIAAGFRNYGFDEAALKLFHSLLQAGVYFRDRRLPELFCGFARDEYEVPVPYPIANHPQAWAAASVPFLIETLLGLTPDAFENRLRIVRPILPDPTDWIEVRRLHVGDASVDLRFEKRANGSVDVQVVATEGTLEVEVVSRA